VGLKLVAVAASVSFLDDVARFGEVRDDALGASFGDTKRGSDVPQPHPGIVGDAQQDLGVARQEGPGSCRPSTHGSLSGNLLLDIYF
jgi:hypothetical protein